MKTTQKEIKVKSFDEQEHLVVATCTEHFAVHRSLERSLQNPKGRKWTITHTPTGSNLIDDLRRHGVNGNVNNLIKVAEFLEESGDDSVLSIEDFTSSALRNHLHQLVKSLTGDFKL
jgi:hypothetical protein